MNLSLYFVCSLYKAKDKTLKNRQKVVQNQEKLQHQARQEVMKRVICICDSTPFNKMLINYYKAAQQRREEKRKADKDKLLQESDPEKARKLEVHNNNEVFL